MALVLKESCLEEFRTVWEGALKQAISQVEPARAFLTRATKTWNQAKV